MNDVGAKITVASYILNGQLEPLIKLMHEFAPGVDWDDLSSDVIEFSTAGSSWRSELKRDPEEKATLLYFMIIGCQPLFTMYYDDKDAVVGRCYQMALAVAGFSFEQIKSISETAHILRGLKNGRI